MLLRGHQFTMEHEKLHTSNRSNIFVNRIVNNWNSLPREVVGASSLNAFKNLFFRTHHHVTFLDNTVAILNLGNALTICY